jgi:hypothetical protein
MGGETWKEVVSTDSNCRVAVSFSAIQMGFTAGVATQFDPWV